MNLEEQNVSLIAGYINTFGPPIAGLLIASFEGKGYNVVACNPGLNMQLEVSKDNKTTVLYLRGLFLDIATTDRDADPLIFDTRITDLSEAAKKISRVLRDRIELVERLMGAETNEDMAQVTKDLAHKFERLKMTMIEPEPKETDSGKSPAELLDDLLPPLE